MNLQKIIRAFYKKLITLYPQEFREQFAESMEQTFNDTYNEHKQQTKSNLLGFVAWTFIETATGVFREHLLLISPGAIMQTTLKTISSSAFISFLLVLPFMIMEIVNRRNYNEEFPFALFIGIWFILFAINLILLPIILGKLAGYRELANHIPTQGNTLLANPKLSATISLGIILSLLTVSLLNSLGVISMERLFNNLNAEKFYVFGIPVISRFIMVVLVSLPILAGVIANGPIVRTLRAGGSLFAHPVNLIIVALLLSSLVFGLTSFIIDQWPCFMGTPICD